MNQAADHYLQELLAELKKIIEVTDTVIYDNTSIYQPIFLPATAFIRLKQKLEMYEKMKAANE